ncbi:phage tail tube protein [Hyphobacterium sp.]|uniref:phage tail tube protein n=1 Tax=Hyphobacterium sp. TaxID=2004662 RepID=UPI003BAA6443
MTSTPRGAASRMYLGIQADFTTPNAVNGDELHFYDENLRRTNQLATDRELGGARHNTGDMTDPGPGLPTVAGQLTVPMDFNQMLWWLYLGFGAPVTTDEGGGNFTHVFKSGAADLPFGTLDLQVRADRIKHVTGLAVNGFTFGTDKADGYRTFQVNVLARDISMLAALSTVGQTAVPARAKAAGSVGIMRIDGVQAGKHVGGNFTFGNGFQPVALADNSPLIGQMDPGDRESGGSPRFRLQSGAGADTIADKWQDETTPFRVEAEWQKSATQSLTLDYKRCFGPKIVDEVSNGAAIEYAGEFTSHQTAAEAALVVTLKNQLDITAVTA